MPIGHVKARWANYTGPDDPRFPYPLGVRRASREAMHAYFEAHQRRWTIVAICGTCGRELIAEEVRAHRHTHLSGKARVMAREWDATPADVRAEFLAYVEEAWP